MVIRGLGRGVWKEEGEYGYIRAKRIFVEIF